MKEGNDSVGVKSGEVEMVAKRNKTAVGWQMDTALLEWAKTEAERKGLPITAYINLLISMERDRIEGKI